MTDVGSAVVKVTGDVRDFAREVERDLNRALARIDLNKVKVEVDTDQVGRSGERAGRKLGDGISKGLDGSKGKFSRALKKAFTPDPELFTTLRAPFAAAFSTPVIAAVATVAGLAALAFVGAFAAALATAGLGAVFLGVGAAALFGAKKSRDDAEKDLAKAEEKVRKAEQRAQSGTAASKRSLADARAELAKTKAAVEDNAAFTKLDSSLAKLGETLKNVGKSASAPLMKPFTKALDLLSAKALKLSPLLHGIFTALAPAVVPLTEGMAGLVEEFLKVLSADPKSLQGIRDSLIALGANLPRLGTALGQFFALMASNENNVRNMGLLFGLLEFVIGNLAVSLFALGKALDGIIIAWDAVGSAIQTAIGWITGTAVPAITSAAVVVGQFFQGIPGIISSAWSSVVGFFSGIISSVTGFISSVAASVIGFFTALPGRVIGALTALPGMMADFFSNMLSNLYFLIGFGIGTVVSFFISLPGRIMGAIQSIPGLVAGVWNSVWSMAKFIVSSGISAVVSFLTQLPGRARSAISALVSVVSSVFSSAKNTAQSQSTSLVNGAINVIKGLPGKIQGALSSVKSAVLRAFSGAGTWLVSAGRSIITGIISGIGSAISGAVSAARNAASRIVEGFKSALKINSPSKVMEIQVGKQIPAGAAVGIEKNMGLVDSQIKGMMGRLTDVDFPAFGAGRPRGGDGASLGGSTLQITIQPGAIVVQGQGREAGQAAAEAILERLGQATLAR